MRTKPILATISVLFLAFSIYAGVLLIDNQDTDTRSRASSTPTIAITTDEVSYKENTNFAVTLKTNTGNNPVDSIQAAIKYDPKVLKAVSINPLQAFPSQAIESQEINESSGLVNYQVAPATGTPPDTVNSSIAIIVFQAKATGSTLIELDTTKSQASIKPGKANIIESYIPLNLIITP
jgi:hypothetical protein